MAFALMLHHFQNAEHEFGQGALTAEQFAHMLEWMGLEYFLEPDEWIERAVAGKLREYDRCLTFDDALLCQYDVALPVLDAMNLKAFWFVYSSVFKGSVEKLELYRYFRTTAFPNIDTFYDKFFDHVRRSELSDIFNSGMSQFDTNTYLSAFSFYTYKDKQFRFVRDKVLGPNRYFGIMDDMISKMPGFSVEASAKNLWMNDSHLVHLTSTGHKVGLHSYSHPTEMAALSASDQRAEYTRNAEHLSGVLGTKQDCASYPCGSYNDDTIPILRDLGVKIAFRSDMRTGLGTVYELPREDHSHIAMKMGMR